MKTTGTGAALIRSAFLAAGMALLPAHGAETESLARTVDVRWLAPHVYREGLIENVCLAPDARSLSLADHVLIENDAWGAGANKLGDDTELIRGDAWAKKELILENPAAFQAWLVFFACQTGTNRMPVIELNGHPLTCPPLRGDETVWHYKKYSAAPDSAGGYLAGGAGFFYIPFPPAWLRKGRNEVVFKAGAEDAAWRLGLADYRNFQKGTERKIEAFPFSSRKSADRGNSWSTQLGSGNSLQGEYMVRLCLKRYRPQGSLTSPVIALSDRPESLPIQSKIAAADVVLEWDRQTPAGTRIDWSVRSGKTPFYSQADWTGWKPVEAGGKVASTGGYLQWKAVLHTDDPLQTPRLAAAVVRAAFTLRQAPPDGALEVVSWQNEPIQHSAFPYEYERYDHPQLQALRKTFELDARVAGAHTEFEKILRLLHWAYAVPLKERFNSTNEYTWNALDYCRLERTADGQIRMETWPGRRRDEFCLTGNLALMQACLSFGITARHVGIGGHEVCEVWSNDYKKWMLLDATRDYYYVDPGAGIPLHTLDLHQHQLPAAIRGGANPHPISPDFGIELMDYFRLIPRNNFLSKPYPRPLNQGTGGMPWPWDGYLNWKDASIPLLLHYPTFTDRPRDLYPSLNQAELRLEYGDQEGSLAVYLDTVTPDFKRYLVKRDQGPWKESPSAFAWPLHPGTNTLEACTENSLGNKGIVSHVVLKRLR